MRDKSHLATPPHSYARRAGVAGATAGALLFVGVAGPLLVTVQAPDGSVVAPAPYTLFVSTFTAGTVFLILALLALRSLHRASGERLPRSGRIGTRISVAGAALLTAFGVVHVSTGLATGRPAEATFLLFGLGMLLLIAGHVALSLGLRRSGVLRSWWPAPLVAAGGALLAVVVGVDFWHHLGFFTLDAAWVALGANLIARSRRATTPVHPQLPTGLPA